MPLRFDVSLLLSLRFTTFSISVFIFVSAALIVVTATDFVAFALFLVFVDSVAQTLVCILTRPLASAVTATFIFAFVARRTTTRALASLRAAYSLTFTAVMVIIISIALRA